MKESNNMTIRTKRINITPDKTLFPKMGNTGYTVAEALSELIDNSIDAREENRSLEINIKIDKQKGHILVEDNGRGMNEEVASNSIKLGASSKKTGELGQFGIGLKSACMSLGKKFTLETSSKGSNEEYILVFDEDEFIANGSWSDFEIKIKKGTDINRSFTKIKIEKLRIKFYGTFFDILKRHLRERFTPFIANKEVKIKVNNDEIKVELFEIFPDSKKEFEIKLSNSEKIKGWTGILKIGSVERSGFNIYRYNRLIRVHEKLGYVYHPSKMSITGEIFINTDSIPVTINKREFDTKNEFYIEFFEKFSEHLKPILAEVQKRQQEEKIKDLPREIKETLKDNILKALNKTEEFKELAKEKKVDLIWKKPSGALPEVMIDKEKFHQVLMNIIDNAFKYCKEGHIEVSMSEEAGRGSSDKNILIKVKDSGVGMTREELDSIFKKFARAQSGSKVNTEGTGLGLYLAKRIVGDHGGEIWAESEGHGLGSTFKIRLPAKGEEVSKQVQFKEFVEKI